MESVINEHRYDESLYNNQRKYSLYDKIDKKITKQLIAWSLKNNLFTDYVYNLELMKEEESKEHSYIDFGLDQSNFYEKMFKLYKKENKKKQRNNSTKFSLFKQENLSISMKKATRVSFQIENIHDLNFQNNKINNNSESQIDKNTIKKPILNKLVPRSGSYDCFQKENNNNDVLPIINLENKPNTTINGYLHKKKNSSKTLFSTKSNQSQPTYKERSNILFIHEDSQKSDNFSIKDSFDTSQIKPKFIKIFSNNSRRSSKESLIKSKRTPKAAPNIPKPDSKPIQLPKIKKKGYCSCLPLF